MRARWGGGGRKALFQAGSKSGTRGVLESWWSSSCWRRRGSRQSCTRRTMTSPSECVAHPAGGKVDGAPAALLALPKTNERPPPLSPLSVRRYIAENGEKGRKEPSPPKQYFYTYGYHDRTLEREYLCDLCEVSFCWSSSSCSSSTSTSLTRPLPRANANAIG